LSAAGRIKLIGVEIFSSHHLFFVNILWGFAYLTLERDDDSPDENILILGQMPLDPYLLAQH
jgi:hypothetical protein